MCGCVVLLWFVCLLVWLCGDVSAMCSKCGMW